MERSIRARVVCVFALFLALVVGWSVGSSKDRNVSAASPQSTADNDLTGTATLGRFQIFHVYYSTAQQGTGMIDSQTGRVWLMKAYKDKDNNQDEGFFEENKYAAQ